MLNDREGELIQPVLQGSHKDRLSAARSPRDDMKALAAYIHSVLALAPGQGAPPPGRLVELKVLVGDAAAGERYFAAEVRELSLSDGRSQRHRRAGSRPAQLQNLWIAGGRGGEAAAAGEGPAPLRRRRR